MCVGAVRCRGGNLVTLVKSQGRGVSATQMLGRAMLLTSAAEAGESLPFVVDDQQEL